MLSVDTSESRSQNLSLLSNSLSSSWTDATGVYSNQSTSWYNESNSNESQNQVYLAVTYQATVVAVLSTAPGGSPTINTATPGEDIYLVYTITGGGYTGQTSTYGVSLPSGMSTVGYPTCTVTVGGTTTCSIEINTGSTASGMIPFTPILTSGTLQIPATTPNLIMQGNFAYVVDAGVADTVWVYVQNPTTGALTPAFNESAPLPPSLPPSTWVPNSVIVVGNSLYIGNASGTNGSNLWRYSINQSNGSLTYIESVTAPTQDPIGTNIGPMTSNGNALYAPDFNSTYVYQYQINPDYSVTYESAFGQPSAAESAWSPSGIGSSSSNAFVADGNNYTVWQFIIESDGSLVSSNISAPTPYPGWNPSNVLISNNQYAYIADDGSQPGLWEYQVNQGSGVLSLTESVVLPNGSAYVYGENILNNFAYILDSTNNQVWTYNLNESTGQITTYANNSVSTNPLGASWSPSTIAFYAPLISISQRGMFNGYIIPGSSFKVSENLNYGNNYGTQTIQATITPADPAITMTPANGQCTLSNGSPNCSITVNAAGNAIIESHVITFTNITSGGAAAQINISPNIIPFSVPRIVFTTPTSPGVSANLNQYCTDPSCATDPESGIHGADTLCESAARSALLAGTYKALLISSTRYPCDATGNCSGSAASSDWVLKADEPYVNVKGGFFAYSNSNAVFPGNLSNFEMYYANGVSDAGYSQVYTGINSVLLTPNDAIGWAYANINSETNYTDYTCDDWRTNSSAYPSGQGYLQYTPSSYPGTSGWTSGYDAFGSSYTIPWMYDSAYGQSSYKCNSNAGLFCVLQ